LQREATTDTERRYVVARRFGRCRARPDGSLFGAAAGTFVAALSIGIVGGLVATYLRRPALVFIVPGVLMLVPGSTGFSSLFHLVAGQTVSGIDAGFNAFVTAMAIAYGLMVSAVVLSPRRAASDESGSPM